MQLVCDKLTKLGHATEELLNELPHTVGTSPPPFDSVLQYVPSYLVSCNSRSKTFQLFK